MLPETERGTGAERLARAMRGLRQNMDVATKQIQETADAMRYLEVRARPTYLIQEEP